MPDLTSGQGRPSRLFIGLFTGILLCWLVLAWLHLRFFSFGCMDGWCYSAPALTAKAPLAITRPFLGTFEGANAGWGMHWPGGPLLTSLFAPFLPHTENVFTTIYLSYWALLVMAATAVVWRITRSDWLALCACILIAGDRLCFGSAWFTRYENLASAAAMAVLLGLLTSTEKHPWLRLIAIGGGMFLMPSLQPVYSGLSLTWLFCFAVRSLVLKGSWREFWAAVIGATAGWGVLIGYYLAAPWLWHIFQNHAHQAALLTRQHGLPRISTALHNLLHIGDPTKTATLGFCAGIAGIVCLMIVVVKSGARWREKLREEEVFAFLAAGFACNLFLAQFSYNLTYWAPAWPFAAVISCVLVSRLLAAWPEGRRFVWAGFVLLVCLHAAYLPGRTWYWYKLGFASPSVMAAKFAASLPATGKVFIPEILWEHYAGSGRTVYMNSIPAAVGDEKEKRYADFIAPLIQPGDILITDAMEGNFPLLNTHGPGWKVLGESKWYYNINGDTHGFDLIAYQKL